MPAVVPAAAGFGSPDEVWFDTKAGGVTSLVYRARPGLPAAKHTAGIGLLIQEFTGDGSGFLHKYLTNGSHAQQVAVGPHDGVFITGGSHFLAYDTTNGEGETADGRLVGNALVFQHEGAHDPHRGQSPRRPHGRDRRLSALNRTGERPQRTAETPQSFVRRGRDRLVGAADHAHVDVFEERGVLLCGSKAPLREHGVDGGQQSGGRGRRVPAFDAELEHHARREGAHGVDVAGALLVAERPVPAAGRSQRGEHVSALGGGAQRAPDEGAEHAIESVGSTDLDGQLAVQVLGLALVDGGEELAPVGEVLVDERSAHAGVLRDRLHRDRRDVARRDERDGGIEEGVASLGRG